jgi:hypothetical protein
MLMKPLTIATLLASLSLILMAGCMREAHAEHGENSTVRHEPAGTASFSHNVPCGDSITLLKQAPANTTIVLNALSCNCTDAPTIVLNAITGDSPRDLCSLQPNEGCAASVPAGSWVSVGITATPGSGSCKVNGYINN